MTYTLRSETINGYKVAIRQEGFESWFTVYIFTPYGTTYQRSNPQPDMARAMRTYRRYLQKAVEMA